LAGASPFRYYSSGSLPIRLKDFQQRDQPRLDCQLALKRGAGQLRFQRPSAITML
jgi:hypothetical protein